MEFFVERGHGAGYVFVESTYELLYFYKYFLGTYKYIGMMARGRVVGLIHFRGGLAMGLGKKTFSRRKIHTF